MKYRKRIYNAIIISALVCSVTAMPVLAAPSEAVQNLQNEQAELENQKSDVQSELDSLQVQLEDLLSRITELESELVETGQEITQTKEELAAAEERRQEQYDAMKLRIRYIYESGGDVATIEKILSSGDITSMLTQAEYSQKVHEYDREQLQAYANTVKEIEDLQNTLETKMKDLQEMEGEYQQQQETLNSTIASKKNEISDLDGLIQDAAQKVLEQQRLEQEAADSGNADHNTQDSGNEDKGESNGENSSSGGSTVVGGTVVSRAESAIGKPYEWGAAGPDSFDCSGLVSFALTGRYEHTWSTADIITWPRVSDPQPGDICITAGHCGVYIGNGMMIHAPQTGDVVKISAVHSGMFYVRY